MDLLKPSRRQFFGLIATAAVAPAIIRAGVLMPIKPQLIIPASGGLYITAEMIATLFAQELYKAGARRAVCMLPKQSHVDLCIPREHRTMPLEQFTEKYIRPGAVVLAGKHRGIGSPLEIPKGVHEGANGMSGGFGVRYIQDYSIHHDTFLSRFDVLHT